MKTRRHVALLTASGLAVLLVSLLAFIYTRTKNEDEFSYLENVALLRQIKQLDAQWELEVLRSKSGLRTNYDVLIDRWVELDRLRAELQQNIAAQHHRAAKALAQGGESLRTAIAEKATLVEHFKSQNSVLRNSLAFLPTAANDVAQAASHSQRETAAATDRLLLDIMIYVHEPSDDGAARIRQALDRLTSTALAGPQPVAEALDIFAMHAGTVLHRQPEVDTLMSGISAVPSAARLDALDALLAGEHEEADAQTRRYRQYLMLFSAALIALLLYAAHRLVRSHATINQVNRQLQDANATLEQRVLERSIALRAAQDELLSIARKAGMAEIANNVLHNVGNVLNSVNVSAGLVSATLRESKSLGLQKAVELLQQHRSGLGHFIEQDPRGRVLPDYLAGLAQALAGERKGVVDELASLTRSIDHIKDIVASQQAYAGSTSLAEPVRIDALLDDALRMNAGSATDTSISVIRQFADVPPLLLDKHKLLQIMLNLIGNARQAMQASPVPAPRLTLAAGLIEDTDERRLEITVADEGTGIPPENLARIFAHGFTTRKDGHGFGLHSCVLAARDMGGTLVAHSDGPGRGAVFTLALPARLAGDMR